MNRKIFLPVASFFGLMLAKSASAVCPVCFVAVSSGVGLCRWLGIEDDVTGLWIGGVVVSLIFWTLDWMKRKNISFAFTKTVVSFSYYALVIAPLYFLGVIGHPLNKVLGIDKLLFGIASGSLVFLASVWLNEFLKKKNSGKVFFPYQKVVIPVSLLLITSLLFYFIGCRNKIF